MSMSYKVLLAGWLVWIAPAGYAAENWSVLPGEGSAAPPCQLTSPHLTLNDGQGETTVWLEITKDTLLVKTKSTLDTEFKDIGLKVDQNAFIAFDEVRNDTDAAYTQAISTITQQFIKGQQVTVTLRFWPTWPTTGKKSIDFSLLGFTKAYQAASCPPLASATPPTAVPTTTPPPEVKP